MAGEPAAATSNPDSEVQTTSTCSYDNRNAGTDAEISSMMSDRCDVGILIANVRRLEVLSEPVVQTLKTVSYIISWEFPPLTFPCWMLCVLLCLTTTKGQLFWAILFAILALAGVGIIVKKAKNNTRNQRFPQSPAIRKYLITQQDVQYHEEREMKEVMSQYREFILDLQPAIIYTCQLLQTIYMILFWKSIYLSLLFYLGSTAAVLSLYIFPTFWTACAAVNLIFLANGRFLALLKSGGKRVRRIFKSRKLKKEEYKKVEENSKVEMPMLQVNDMMTIDVDSDKLVDDAAMSSAGEDPDGDGSDTEQNREFDSLKAAGKTSMVDRFRELRQRHKKLNSGSCSSCAVTFTTLLKRRRYCRNCGNHFCAKKKKVPTATLR